jgi:hypothetical protein
MQKLGLRRPRWFADLPRGVIPAKAGIHFCTNELSAKSIPAFAGMTLRN